MATRIAVTRVRDIVTEFERLKALGWRSRPIVAQVMGEAMAIGIADGIIAVALGFCRSQAGRHARPAADRLDRPAADRVCRGWTHHDVLVS
jgi:hypothetical protein